MRLLVNNASIAYRLNSPRKTKKYNNQIGVEALAFGPDFLIPLRLCPDRADAPGLRMNEKL